jgi:spermidine synthase
MKLTHNIRPASLPLLPPEQLNRLLDMPDGIIYNWRGPNNRYIIEKTGTVLALYFSHPQENPTAAIMSEIDLLDPLNLLFGYNRAFILTLIWQPQPQRIFMLGFAGGRVPAVLHHYLPAAQIDVAEIDPDVVDVAREYFGVTLDHRLQVIFGDGRATLEQEESHYDMIFVDAFVGAGQTPPHLATFEFYTLCRERLSEGGVVSVNLCNHGPQYRAQIDTFRAVFDKVYLIDYETALVMYGTSQTLLTVEAIVEKTAALLGTHDFHFPLLNYAHRIIPPAHAENYLSNYGPLCEPLRDAKT